MFIDDNFLSFIDWICLRRAGRSHRSGGITRASKALTHCRTNKRNKNSDSQNAMPRLLKVELTGRRRRSPFRKRKKKIHLTTIIQWDQPGDVSRNGTDMLVSFIGRDNDGAIDRGGDDNLGHNLHRIPKGFHEEEKEGVPLGFRLTTVQFGPTSFVRVRYKNKKIRVGILGRRRFDEDPASRDEVFARVVLFDIGKSPPGIGAPGEIITNTLPDAGRGPPQTGLYGQIIECGGVSWYTGMRRAEI